MTKLEQNTTNDIGGLAIFISRALKKIPPIIGMLAVLSLGQTNLSPLIGGDLGIFASPAEARPGSVGSAARDIDAPSAAVDEVLTSSLTRGLGLP